MRSLPKGTGLEQKQYLKEWKNALRWAKPQFREAYLHEQEAEQATSGTTDHERHVQERPEGHNVGAH